MLRLPSYSYHRPTRLDDALALLAEHARNVMPIAGGTDLVPNMKHRLFEPAHLVGLKGIAELSGIRIEGDWLEIGSVETLSTVGSHPLVRRLFPSLAEAAAHVAGPQLRNAGTIGGNLCLDTRCTYYNQTAFWREALGYCLKKEGTVCHVTRVGKKCVAAHSADTPPVMMTLGAVAQLASAAGRREVPVSDFFVADGIHNNRVVPGELVTKIRIPIPADEVRTGYAKLRQRGSIDFPLLTVAVAARMGEGDRIAGIRGVVTALGSRPRDLTGWDDIAVGHPLNDDLVDALAERAHGQCHPLENIPVDPEWRRAMVPVFVKRALESLRAS